MRFLITFFLLTSGVATFAQIIREEAGFFSRIQPGNQLPEKLLSARTVVLYPFEMTAKELKSIQKSFQEAGVDAVAYFDIDLFLAGKDVSSAMAFYFNQRSIANLVFFRRTASGYEVLITFFNGKNDFVSDNQPAWHAENGELAELLKIIYRTSAADLTRTNLLINDYPEIGLTVNPIAGRRAEFFAIDLKVDQLAVPMFGDKVVDTRLEEIFSTYPFKYKLTEPGLSERELRAQGFLYTLCFVHTRGSIARELLGYDVKKPESAYVSVTYPDGQAQLKNIPAEKKIYKFYFKHIQSGNVFLGTKWDADLEWDQALKNHLMAFKTELKVN